jgi:hypothetical protein
MESPAAPRKSKAGHRLRIDLGIAAHRHLLIKNLYSRIDNHQSNFRLSLTRGPTFHKPPPPWLMRLAVTPSSSPTFTSIAPTMHSLSVKGIALGNPAQKPPKAEVSLYLAVSTVFLKYQGNICHFVWKYLSFCLGFCMIFKLLIIQLKGNHRDHSRSNERF